MAKQKIILGVAALAAAGAIIIGAGYAFFSDVITGNGTATAGTLDISGTVGLERNGTVVTSPIANLNPGDIISFDVSSITNNGSKSAWIRKVLNFTTISSTPNTGSNGVGSLVGYLWVCTTTTGATVTAQQTALIAASNAVGGFSANIPANYTCNTATTSGVFGAPATYTLASNVINGTGASAEVESGAPAGNVWTPAAAPVIYFDAAAGNAAQSGTVAFTISVQALQYRNNTTSPTEAQWSTVVTTPFGL